MRPMRVSAIILNYIENGALTTWYKYLPFSSKIIARIIESQGIIQRIGSNIWHEALFTQPRMRPQSCG